MAADGKGVYFQDITPRWGVAWDVFGNGKTSVKYSKGKYLDGVQVGRHLHGQQPGSGESHRQLPTRASGPTPTAIASSIATW